MIVNSESNIECLADGEDDESDNDNGSGGNGGNEELSSSNGAFENSNGNNCKREPPMASAVRSSTAYPAYPSITRSISSGPTDEAYLNKIGSKLAQVFNCMVYGVYNQDNSTTLTNLTIPLSITYADGTGADGYFVSDDVYFGNIKVEKVTFGLNINTYKQNGVLGLGFRANQSPFQNGYSQYDSFPYRLKTLGIIDKVVYSFCAPYEGSSTDSIIFGGYNSNRYDHSTGLTLVPIVDYTVSPKAGDGPYYISITLNSISFTSPGVSNKLVASGNAPAILDLGTTSSVVPYYIFNEIITRFNFQWSSQLNSYVVSESEIKKESSYVTFNFQNAFIKVPVIDFTYPVIDGDTLSATGLRSISISYSNDDYFLFGDDFLSSVFFVVDLEEKNVALGQVNTNSGGSSDSIVVVTDGIVDAVKSSNWDYVYGYEGSTSLKVKEAVNPDNIKTAQPSGNNLQLYIAGLGTELDW
ncbi:hypothetical protein PMKS-003376 [Pichia membranifaciens]|uniref:Peptidase A1 domain-containing protein n=1 Tax=Pichia membranifaciens TaxID=4926 RepID=A0A1Q2YK03_9ASCO|nr:hypothetical protein PMKS-003376 [Pichia membranifaciens]